MNPTSTTPQIGQSPEESKEGSRNPSLLVLGLGNDMMRDDAVGLRVAKAVRARVSHIPEIEVVETGEMGLSLLDFIAGYSALVLIDAVQTNKAPPGFLHEMDGGDLKVLPTVSPHVLGIGEILSLGRTLGLPMPKRVKIFAIEVEDAFTLGMDLTGSVRAALPSIRDRVTKAVLVIAHELIDGSEGKEYSFGRIGCAIED